MSCYRYFENLHVNNCKYFKSNFLPVLDELTMVLLMIGFDACFHRAQQRNIFSSWRKSVTTICCSMPGRRNFLRRTGMKRSSSSRALQRQRRVKRQSNEWSKYAVCLQAIFCWVCVCLIANVMGISRFQVINKILHGKMLEVLIYFTTSVLSDVCWSRSLPSSLKLLSSYDRIELEY